MQRCRVLVSGAGIAGLTLAILLKEKGFEPLVVEREPGLRREGYMMDFFGTGWDVAERMGLIDALRAISYPIERMEFVDGAGRPFLSFPIDRLRKALSSRYVYLRRPDLEQILFARAMENEVTVRFGSSIETMQESGAGMRVRFVDGSEDEFALVFGADGVHSHVRALAFGQPEQFERFLGYYVAAFHVALAKYSLGHSIRLYEETDRTVWLYPTDESRGDATYIFRHEDIGFIPHARRLPMLREQFAKSGWIAEDVLHDVESTEPIFFDSLTLIAMPDWHRGRVALLGDACGCLTLAAGQGSHMAMAGAYVLARELDRGADHQTAFEAYQNFLKPHVARKQRDAARFASLIVPSVRSHPILRRLALRLIFSAPAIKYAMRSFGTRSVLPADA